MTNKKLIIKLCLLFKPYVKSFVFIILGLLISSVLSIVIPMLNKNIIDQGFLNRDFHKILTLCFLMFITMAFENLIAVGREYIRINLYSNIRIDLFSKAYKHLLNINMSYFSNKSSTEILSRIQYDLDNMLKITEQEFFSPLTQIFNMIGAAIGLFLISPKLTLIILAFIPVKYFTIKYFSKRREKIVDICIKCNEVFAKSFGDSIDGIKEVKLFNLFNSKIAEFYNRQNDVVNNNKKYLLLDSYNILFDSVFLKLITIVLYITGGYLFFKKDMSIGSIFAFISYSEYIVTPIYSVLNIRYILSGILPSARSFYEFLNIPLEKSIEGKKVQGIKGNIKFENICFAYDENSQLLENINFDIKCGQKVAVIGKNGAGKSTIINLILRFFEPQSGSIYIDGENIRNFNINEYRKIISPITQQVYLFDGTIKENILLNNETSYQEFIKAISASQLSGFIDEVGEDYYIDLNGKNLSGGQKQKIAIARAIIKDSPIVILDEATSNLDAVSSKKTYELIDTVFKKKTVIIITHKLDILKAVDKVILLDKGKIAAVGSHEALMESNSTYKNMLCSHYIK